MSGFLQILGNVGSKKLIGLGVALYMLNSIDGVSPDVRAYTMGGAAGLFFLAQGFADGLSKKYQNGK